LAGSYQGAMATGYSFQHCNAFVYDRQQKLCTLKNKRMGNFYPQQGPPCSSGRKPTARYVAGYRWESLINEINTASPNMTSGMQYLKASPAWSTDEWATTNNSCSQGHCQSCVANVPLKPVAYDVRPGAIISSKNVTTGPYANSPHTRVERFRVENMQECANLAATRANSQGGPYTGANAWTFHPDYTIGEATDELSNQRDNWSGTCSLGHVREPYYQTLTPADNGAISGFAQSSLSREIRRFLF